MSEGRAIRIGPTPLSTTMARPISRTSRSRSRLTAAIRSVVSIIRDGSIACMRQSHQRLGQGIQLHHLGQRRQRLRLTQRCPDPRSGQTIGQRQATQDHQVGVVADQGRR